LGFRKKTLELADEDALRTPRKKPGQVGARWAAVE
jgi:hypothetical protein